MTNSDSKERLWHRRYGHLGEQDLQKLAIKGMIEQFDYNAKKQIGFCETCISALLKKAKDTPQNPWS